MLPEYLLMVAAATLVNAGQLDDLPTPIPDDDNLLPADPTVPPPPSSSFHRHDPMENGFTRDGRKLWEGDLLLTPEQEAAWHHHHGPQSSSSSVGVDRRKANADLNSRWTNARVPYRFDASSVADREAIQKGLQHWTEHTCLTFNEVGGTPNYPHLIFKKEDGCTSYVGKITYWNGQTVSIGAGCADWATVAHEVGHAIGFQHEHVRPDRDQHVRISVENIVDGYKERAFDIQRNVNSYGIGYDYTSLMHYGAKYFSKNGKNTITPLDVTKTFLIGHRNSGLSFADKKLANVMYNCSDRCGSSKPACQNSGFVDKNCRCVCPPGFDGNLCQNKVDIPGIQCTHHYWATGVVSSPNYPNKYPKGSRCIWVMYAQNDNQRIRAEFLDFDLIQNSGDTCPWDYLEVRTGSDTIQPGTQYCKDQLKGKTLTSTGHRMVLLFKADYDRNKGFQVKFSSV